MIDIVHRDTGAVLYHAADAESVRDAVEAAVRVGADLTDADLTGADLTDARLDDADLTDADLTGADLTDARLDGADLTDARLTVADLTGASLTGALLIGARLDGARLTVADLTGASLTGALLIGADLTDARLTVADLTGARLTGARLTVARLDGAPMVEDLDRRILAAIEQPGCSLDMSWWHTCETTHCMAGWAIHLAGEAGLDLERRIGPSAAGAVIFARSTGRVPDFYATTGQALRDLRARVDEVSS